MRYNHRPIFFALVSSNFEYLFVPVLLGTFYHHFKTVFSSNFYLCIKGFILPKQKSEDQITRTLSEAIESSIRMQVIYQFLLHYEVKKCISIPVLVQLCVASDEHLWPCLWHHHKHIHMLPEISCPISLKPGNTNRQKVF